MDAAGRGDNAGQLTTGPGPRVWRAEPLHEILTVVAAGVARGEAVELVVLDPDRGRGLYAGEQVDGHVHRPWRVWVDLADRLTARLCTPHPAGDGLVRIRFEPLPPPAAAAPAPVAAEKYGTGSAFARISKLEDPGFVVDLREALARCRLAPTARVLALGCNSGNELVLVLEAAPAARLVGIDHAESAVAVARARFPAAAFVTADLATLPALALGGRFDLVLTLSTLQSPGVDDRALLRQLVQDHLAPTGALILGLPNCRYVDGEVSYGARMRNFAQPELGLLVKDVAFYRKYLQQHHRQVFVTGKHELFVTAVPTAE